MTTAQLNKDIKKLNSEIYRHSFMDKEIYSEYISSEAYKEFARVYMADVQFKYINKESVLILLSLNLKHRFIPLNNFGISIEL